MYVYVYIFMGLLIFVVCVLSIDIVFSEGLLLTVVVYVARSFDKKHMVKITDHKFHCVSRLYVYGALSHVRLL